jgi:hypothetical protein
MLMGLAIASALAIVAGIWFIIVREMEAAARRDEPSPTRSDSPPFLGYEDDWA